VDLLDEGARGLTPAPGLTFFRDVAWDDLPAVRPTRPSVPRALEAAVTEARMRVLLAIQCAGDVGDVDAETDAWKALFCLDRLLLTTPLRHRGGRKGQGQASMQALLAERLRACTRGAWQQLWADTGGAGEGAGRGTRRSTAAEDARAVAALLEAGEASRALRRVTEPLQVAEGAEAMAQLRALFPVHTGAPLPRPGPAQWDQELVDLLQDSLSAALSELPRKSAPGPSGSRFEHWAHLAQDLAGTKLAAKALARLALGLAPPEVVEAFGRGRVVPLVKPGGACGPWCVARRCAG